MEKSVTLWVYNETVYEAVSITQKGIEAVKKIS